MNRDTEILQGLIRELRWDPRVDEVDVRVEVEDGVVTLSGTVDAFAKRQAAGEAAHRMAGVRDVANDLRVRIPRPFARTDTEIAHAVRHALESDVRVPHERIHSTVTDGLVSLQGKVDYWYQREDAERAVRHLAGVMGVVDRLTIRGPKLEAEELREEIAEALERRAERAARHLDIAIVDGTVTLSGTVRAWADKEAILGTVRHSPGVRAIEERIEIDPAV